MVSQSFLHAFVDFKMHSCSVHYSLSLSSTTRFEMECFRGSETTPKPSVSYSYLTSSLNPAIWLRAIRLRTEPVELNSSISRRMNETAHPPGAEDRPRVSGFSASRSTEGKGRPASPERDDGRPSKRVRERSACREPQREVF